MNMQLNEIKCCRYGKMIYNKRDIIGKSIDVYGEYSENEVTLFRQMITEGMYVLDVGANIGSHTLAFSRLVGNHGKVFAFEPQRILFQMMAGTMAINSITNVYCYQKAVGEQPSSLLVPNINYAVEIGNWSCLSLGQWQEGEPVEVITIDDLNLPFYNFMKIDVEGMEISVLKGAKESILKFRPFMYIEYDMEEINDPNNKQRGLKAYIDSLGYDIYLHPALFFYVNNYAEKQENVFGENVGSTNIICIPKEFTGIKMNGFEKLTL